MPVLPLFFVIIVAKVFKCNFISRICGGWILAFSLSFVILIVVESLYDKSYNVFSEFNDFIINNPIFLFLQLLSAHGAVRWISLRRWMRWSRCSVPARAPRCRGPPRSSTRGASPPSRPSSSRRDCWWLGWLAWKGATKYNHLKSIFLRSIPEHSEKKCENSHFLNCLVSVEIEKSLMISEKALNFANGTVEK